MEGNWYPNSPLWNVFLALAYRVASLWGFFLLSAATIVLLLMFVVVLGRRLGSRPLPGLLGLLVVLAAAFPMLNARATLAVQVLLLLAVYLPLRLGAGARVRSSNALPVVLLAVAFGLSVLGNWVHLSFLVLAPALAVVWAVVWLLTPGLRPVRRAVLIAAGGVGWIAGLILSPYGLVTGLDRTRAVQEACQGLIVEWSSPFDANMPRVFLFMSAIAVLVAAGTGWWLSRRWRAGRPTPGLAALALIGVPAALAGLFAARFIGVALLTLAPVAAAATTKLVDRLRARPPAWSPSVMRTRLREYSTGRFWRVVLTATLVVLSPGVVLLAAQHSEPSERAILTGLPPGCHLFSTPDLGGSAVLLRPDALVWIDGRADFFGRDMLLLGYDFYSGSAHDVVPSGATCVLVDTAKDLTVGLRERLGATSQWRLNAEDGTFELWLPTESAG